VPSKVTTTEQLTNWEGSLGDAYVERNAPTPERVRARMRWLAGILECMRGDLPKSILEVGANIGLNLRSPTLDGRRAIRGRTERKSSVHPPPRRRVAAGSH
jgi:hypothetical protein